MEQQLVKGAELEEFERAVYFRPKENRVEENDAATRALIMALRQLREGAGFAGYGSVAQPLVTRFCAAVVALISDPGYNLTQTGFDLICSEKAALDTAFRASAFRSSDWVFGVRPQEDQMPLKFLSLFTTGSRLDWNLEPIFRDDPRGTFALWLALLSYGQNLTKEAHERREKLLGMWPIFEAIDPPDECWNLMCSAYMHCSYALGEKKHELKGMIHRMIAKKLSPVVPKKMARRRKGKPRLLCVFEWWWSQHAMYRSYAHSIDQLRKKFHLIGCCAGKNVDEKAKGHFDEWVELDGENMNLSSVAPVVHAKAADIIYYPSVGMAIWVIALASLRLAPIQVMSYGHPATSMSPEIDYGVIESDCLNEEAFNEKMIGLPPGTVRPTQHQEISVRHKPKDGGVVKIAIPAMQVKVTYPFIEALQKIRERAKKRVEFWFFSAAHGVGLEPMAFDIARQLDGTWCQEQQGYQEYVKSIAGCDIALFSFPFGGANSCYDAMAVGLPMVSLKGKQPHSMSDASIMTRAKLPQKLVTHSVEEYVDRVVELVNDFSERKRIARIVSRVDVASFHKPDDSGAFLKVFEGLYAKHSRKPKAKVIPLRKAA